MDLPMRERRHADRTVRTLTGAKWPRTSTNRNFSGDNRVTISATLGVTRSATLTIIRP
jgi:hypothetical protein